MSELSLEGRGGGRFSDIDVTIRKEVEESEPNLDLQLPLIPVRFRPVTDDDRARYRRLHDLANERFEKQSQDRWHTGGKSASPDDFVSL